MKLEYSVEKTAAELMLEPMELLEVYQVFFEDGIKRLDECHQGLTEKDLARVKRMLHAIKGVAASLQMSELTELVTAMEAGADNKDQDRLGERFAAIVREFHRMEAEVDRFYNKGSE